MPIPAFDAHGNIPVGDLFASGANSLVHTTLQEVHDRFVAQVPESARRPHIWNGWMSHRAELEGVGIQYATLVDGSFTTTEQDAWRRGSVHPVRRGGGEPP